MDSGPVNTDAFNESLVGTADEHSATFRKGTQEKSTDNTDDVKDSAGEGDVKSSVDVSAVKSCADESAVKSNSGEGDVKSEVDESTVRSSAGESDSKLSVDESAVQSDTDENTVVRSSDRTSESTDKSDKVVPEENSDEPADEPMDKSDDSLDVTELKTAFIQKGHELAAEKGFSIFIKLIDLEGNCQYYGTNDLVRQYHLSGLKVRRDDVVLCGESGLPLKDKYRTADGDSSDEDFEPPTMSGVPNPHVAGGNKTGLRRNPVRLATFIDPRQLYAEDNQASSSMSESAAGEGEAPLLQINELPSKPGRGRPRKRKADNPMKHIVKLPLKKRVQSAPVERKRRGRKPRRLIAEGDETQEKVRGRSARNEKKVQCQYCEMRFRDKWHLDRHERSHTGEKPHSCEDCGKTFSSKSHFKEHMLIHQDKKDFVCKLCGRDFHLIANLHRHEKHHETGRCFACKQCKQVFSQDVQLKVHEEDHLSDEQKSLVCVICGDKFGTSEAYASHNRKEHNALLFLCGLCDEGFQNMSKLKSHLLIHSTPDTRPYQCDQCGKTYKSANALKWHAEMHSGKSFPCEICNHKFYRQADLTKHEQTHSSERNFVCEKCGAQFKTAHYLGTHQRRHLGLNLRKYSCGTCGKSFATTGHLKRHEVIHDGAKPYKCQFCNKKFNRQDNLKTHLKVHGVTSTPPKAQTQKSESKEVALYSPKTTPPNPQQQSDSESYDSMSESSEGEELTPPVRQAQYYPQQSQQRPHIPQLLPAPPANPSNLPSHATSPPAHPSNLQTHVRPPPTHPSNLPPHAAPPPAHPSNLPLHVPPPPAHPSNLPPHAPPPAANPSNLPPHVLYPNSQAAMTAAVETLKTIQWSHLNQ